jgi:hypothetical protein
MLRTQNRHQPRQSRFLINLKICFGGFGWMAGGIPHMVECAFVAFFTSVIVGANQDWQIETARGASRGRRLLSASAQTGTALTLFQEHPFYEQLVFAMEPISWLNRNYG